MADSVMTFNIMTDSIKTFCIMGLNAMIFSRITDSKMAFSITQTT